MKKIRLYLALLDKQNLFQKFFATIINKFFGFLRGLKCRLYIALEKVRCYVVCKGPKNNRQTFVWRLFLWIERREFPYGVRATCEQSAKVFSLEETKFLKRKTVDTFNANRSRQSPILQILKPCISRLF